MLAKSILWDFNPISTGATVFEYIKELQLYWILVPSAHILLTFCIRIGSFDRSCVFGFVQVFRVPCIIIIRVHVQRTDVGYCG